MEERLTVWVRKRIASPFRVLKSTKRIAVHNMLDLPICNGMRFGKKDAGRAILLLEVQRNQFVMCDVACIFFQTHWCVVSIFSVQRNVRFLFCHDNSVRLISLSVHKLDGKSVPDVCL